MSSRSAQAPSRTKPRSAMPWTVAGMPVSRHTARSKVSGSGTNSVSSRVV